MGSADAEEDHPKDTSHSAVKAMKARFARSRKVPAAIAERDVDERKEAEGSERQLQASAIWSQTGTCFARYHDAKPCKLRSAAYARAAPIVQQTSWSRPQAYVSMLSCDISLLWLRTARALLSASCTLDCKHFCAAMPASAVCQGASHALTVTASMIA